jgi:hypothetical protein
MAELRTNLPAELEWTSDACPLCFHDPEHSDRRCMAVLPTALLVDDGASVSLAYRCRCGHDWMTTYDRASAVAHAEASRELLITKPASIWPPRPAAGR